MKENRDTILYYRDLSVFAEETENVDSYMEYILKGHDMEVFRVGDPEDLMEAVKRQSVRLILFYLGSEEYPDEDVKSRMLSFLSCLRSITEKPIMLYYGGRDEALMLRGFKVGADEFIDNRVTVMELVSRIKRQVASYKSLCEKETKAVFRVSGLEIDDAAKIVTVEGNRVNLTPTEYKILMLLIKQQGKVLSNEQIYEAIWNMEPVGVDNTIAVHIRHLREKIESNPRKPKWVQVVWGRGYKVG